MDNKKFEKLIDLIINENEEQARALFHDIVVEKSRQIYEGLMDEEMGMGQDQSMGMLDELSAENDAEEQGAFESDEEFDDIEVGDDGMGDEEVDLDSEEFGGEEGEEELEDRVVDLEDKLDQLMAEFEEIMGNDSDEEGQEGEEEFGDEEAGDEMMESEEDDLEESEETDEDEDKLEEAIQLKKVSVTHGDNGVQTKSVVAGKNSMISSNGASAANLNKGYQDSGKGGTQGGVLNPATKDIKHAGAYGNSPNSFKFKDKGEAAPKAKHGDDGQNTKSVIESKKSVKKPVAKAATTKKIVK